MRHPDHVEQCRSLSCVTFLKRTSCREYMRPFHFETGDAEPKLVNIGSDLRIIDFTQKAVVSKHRNE